MTKCKDVLRYPLTPALSGAGRGTSRPTGPYEVTWPVLVALAGTLIAAGFRVAFALWGRVPVPLPVCLLYTLTGIPCATCGTTRAFQALARGDVASALAYQPLIMLLYLASTLAVLTDVGTWGLWGRQWLPGVLGRLRVSALTVVTLVLVNWAYLILFLSPRVHRWLGLG